jgi:nucleolar protein 56
MEIFQELRGGKIPETEDGVTSRKKVPDLRNLLLEYEKKRIKEEFTDDMYIVKLGIFRNELHKIINSYYEKIQGFGILAGYDKTNQDPCIYIRNFKPAQEGSGMLPIMESISDAGVNVCDLRDRVNTFLSERVRTSFPNVTELLGVDLAIDFLVISGGLKKMIKMPAGTLQIIGAEKAFFSHMRRGTRNPKHGIIFKYAGLASLPPRYRGRVARTIANKLAIAVRADYAHTIIDVASMKKTISDKMKIRS